MKFSYLGHLIHMFFLVEILKRISKEVRQQMQIFVSYTFFFLKTIMSDLENDCAKVSQIIQNKLSKLKSDYF